MVESDEDGCDDEGVIHVDEHGVAADVEAWCGQHGYYGDDGYRHDCGGNKVAGSQGEI